MPINSCGCCMERTFGADYNAWSALFGDVKKTERERSCCYDSAGENSNINVNRISRPQDIRAAKHAFEACVTQRGLLYISFYDLDKFL